MASLTRLRKRPRVASVAKDSESDDEDGGGGVFAERSDSESESEHRGGSVGASFRGRVSSTSGKGACTPAALSRTEQAYAQPDDDAQNGNDEDTLDVFMSTMEQMNEMKKRTASTPHARELTPCSSRSASPERPSGRGHGTTTNSNGEKSAEELARNAERERRSLNLGSVDHSKVEYAALEKALYTPYELERESLLQHAESVGVHLSGTQVCPIDDFAELDCALPESVIAPVLRDFQTPTAVQRAVIPAALAGHDILATAPTGSGKTLAFLLPLLAHARGSARAVVLAPTRELASQIAVVCCEYGGARIAACITGGTDKYVQVNNVRRAKVWVATPGRLIDLIKARATRMKAVTAIAIDEADRMLDLGFESQVRSILAQIRPDALRLMLSATMPARVSALARDVLHEPAVISPTKSSGPASAWASASASTSRTGTRTGDDNTPARVADGVREHYVQLTFESERWDWLSARLPELTDGVHGDGGGGGLVVLFCRTRGTAAALANRLRATDIPVACVHGETDADDRDALIDMFRRGDVRVLVSTDLAARGLHIDGVAAVVNYEPAKDWDWHVHRVGRTGRAGGNGDAYTLLVSSCTHDTAFAHKARAALRAMEAPVPQQVDAVARADTSSHSHNAHAQRGRWKNRRGGRNAPRDPNNSNRHG